MAGLTILPFLGWKVGININWLCSGESIVVEHLTPDPEIEGFNPASVNFTNILRAAFSYKSFFVQFLCAYNLGL